MGSALLVTPVFAATVIVLILNDHIAKAVWPGVVTGKLSDVAGVAMVAIVATALVRRAFPAFVAVSIAFAALKTVGSVADAAAPLLGGRTLTDATDLAALLVLVPLWRWMQQPSADAEVGAVASRAAVWGTATLKMIALAMAALATSATSCFPVGVESVVASDRGFVVSTPDGPFESLDGGETWLSLSGPGDTLGNVSRTACVDRVCFELVDGGVIRTEPGQDAVDEFTVSDEQLENLIGNQADTCSSASSVFSSIAAVELDDGVRVVVTMGEYGVLQRDGAGEWSWRSVAEFDYDGELDRDPGAGRLSGRSFRMVALLAAGSAFVAGIAAGALSLRRRQSPWWAAFQALAGIGALGVVVVVVSSATFFVNPDRPRGVPYSALWWFVPPMFSLVVVIAMVQWLARPRPASPTPPAPPPSAPPPSPSP